MSRFQKKRFNNLLPREILDFHDKLIARHGGAKGHYPDSLGKAESIIAQFHYVSSRYKAVEALAAYLMYLIIKGHIFPDGNKRTGLLSGMVFLNINGFHLHANEKELELFAINVADSDSQLKDMIISRMKKWIGARLKRA
ncbi:type II toxin-antitoxin system death-on-curing family toxin [Desulfosporosinus shakirovi]|uniref:type II toxin-antitoxin system death-on-curing family toxin n=1 Tax=Desulfosporosinus shakirovi TaxID=2885154 RepID=UPI001E449428|nr:type II toxin-antitoxin system death-on-curing family toxin [Desulfosporosinus sp. SRJS8]MCB8815337.1 type II toxin-antitoxin system death-on-curing family toxin [Desulfosporosinus sp. SRJS8]